MNFLTLEHGPFSGVFNSLTWTLLQETNKTNIYFYFFPLLITNTTQIQGKKFEK